MEDYANLRQLSLWPCSFSEKKCELNNIIFLRAGMKLLEIELPIDRWTTIWRPVNVPLGSKCPELFHISAADILI